MDCEDANNNTPLSEAAGGGHVDTIQLLIQRGADLNSRGRYQRVPLWRAAFGGHLQAVQVCWNNVMSSYNNSQQNITNAHDSLLWIPIAKRFLSILFLWIWLCIKRILTTGHYCLFQTIYQALLEHGGDPRLIADDGTNALQVRECIYNIIIGMIPLPLLTI